MKKIFLYLLASVWLVLVCAIIYYFAASAFESFSASGGVEELSTTTKVILYSLLGIFVGIPSVMSVILYFTRHK